jgi:two-component system, NarL family, invasion response regulator UvrY
MDKMHTMKKLSILHIDDHQILSDCLKQLISLEGKYEITQQLDSTKNTLDILNTSNIDILIADISVDGTDMCALIKRVKSKYPNMPIIALSMHEDLYVIKGVLKAGADAYVSKKSPYANLVNALEATTAGKKYICPETSLLFATSISLYENNSHEKLTYREFHIFSLLSQGASVNDIANKLNLSPKTISSHKSRIMEKMAFKSNADMVKYYLQNVLHD